MRSSRSILLLSLTTDALSLLMPRPHMHRAAPTHPAPPCSHPPEADRPTAAWLRSAATLRRLCPSGLPLRGNAAASPPRHSAPVRPAALAQLHRGWAPRAGLWRSPGGAASLTDLWRSSASQLRPPTGCRLHHIPASQLWPAAAGELRGSPGAQLQHQPGSQRAGASLRRGTGAQLWHSPGHCIQLHPSGPQLQHTHPGTWLQLHSSGTQLRHSAGAQLRHPAGIPLWLRTSSQLRWGAGTRVRCTTNPELWRSPQRVRHFWSDQCWLPTARCWRLPAAVHRHLPAVHHRQLPATGQQQLPAIRCWWLPSTRRRLPTACIPAVGEWRLSADASTGATAQGATARGSAAPCASTILLWALLPVSERAVRVVGPHVPLGMCISVRCLVADGQRSALCW